MKYRFVSHEQNMGHFHNIKITTEFLENVAKFRYVEKTLTDPNFMHEDTKRLLNSGNAQYPSVQNCLSSCLYLNI